MFSHFEKTPLYISLELTVTLKQKKKYILEMDKSDKNYINNKSQNI